MVPTEIPAPTGKLIDQGQDIVGVWQIDHPDWETAYMIIRSDGTYTFSPHTDGSRPSQSGKYWFEGSVFNILSDFCGKPDKYSLKRNDVTGQPATLSFTVIADDCAGEVRILTKQPPVPVEP